MHVLCRTHALCRDCRADTPDGQKTRDRLLKNDRVGVGFGPRFTCPHGRGDVGAFVPWPEPPPSKGFGDSIARAANPIARVMGLDDCGLCAKTQEKFNATFPYQIDRPA